MDKAKRKAIIAGNWKMNKTASEAAVLVDELVPAVQDAGCEVVICTPYTDLVTAVEKTKGTNIHVGAENVHFEKSGAFTGEISADMLVDLGVEDVIVGHSERRTLFGETDADVAAKCTALARHGISPIVCVGEPAEVYDAGDTVAYVAGQVRASLEGATLTGVDLAVAYEPVWAIGSGRVPSPEHVQTVAAAVRAAIAQVRCDKRAASARILYGGSVKPGNAAAFASCPDVDGVLVGGDSLNAEAFVDIVGRVLDA